jgi:hypothetical protein
MEGGDTEIEGADIDNDGDIDLLSIGDHGSPHINTQEHGVMVWFNDGNANWNVYQSGEFGYGGIAIGDANNDGKWDIAYGMHHNYSGADFGNQVQEVATGDGSGKTWSPWDDNLGMQGQEWGMFGTDFGDFDNDGWLDVGSAAFGYPDGLWLYRNNHDGTWTPKGIQKGGNCGSEFRWGDINADGNLDFVDSNEMGWAWLGDGTGKWSPCDSALKFDWLSGPGLGDANGDGFLEYSFTAYLGSGSMLAYVFSWDDGAKSWKNSSTGIQLKDYYLTDLADMDSDGNIDLVAAGKNSIDVYKGDGTGKWTLAANISTGASGYSALRVVGDLDHNGYNDIAAVFSTGSDNAPHVYLNDAPASTLGITLTSPHGNEKFKPGCVRFVDWVSCVPGGGKGTVSLELSTAGSSGPWTSIASGLPNGGRYQWTVPNSPSKNCYIRATVTAGGTASGTNPKPFEIIGSSGPSPVAITLITPNGNENWTVGTSHDITWSASGGTGTLTVNLEYCTQGSGGPWNAVSAGEANDGAYAWNVPDTPSENCYVKATVTDLSSPPQSASDSSNGNFTIYKYGQPPPPPQPVLSYVTISPISVSLIVGNTAPFTARTFLTDGSEITNASVGWGVTGGLGTVSPSSGYSTTFTAVSGGIGYVNVSASYGGMTVTNKSSVSTHNPPPPVQLKAVEITPATISGTVGEQFSLSAKAYDKDHIEIASGVTFAWEVVGSFGTLASLTGPSVWLNATASGSGQVKATATLNSTSVANTTQVSISEPGVMIYRLVLTPASISGNVGQSFAFEAKAYDANNNDITSQTVFTWSISKTIGVLSSTKGSKVTLALESAGKATVYVDGSCGGEYKQASAAVDSKDAPVEIPAWVVFALVAIIAIMISLMLIAGWRKRRKKDEEERRRREMQMQQQAYAQGYPPPQYPGQYP